MPKGVYVRTEAHRTAMSANGKMGGGVLQHGAARHGALTPEYKSWADAKNRCFNSCTPRFSDYGARGITMCEQWRTDFSAFLTDMGQRPPGTSLDRWPDNDGNYEPGNCRWATKAQQALNRRPRRWRRRPADLVPG